jgi:hypothetical protein
MPRTETLTDVPAEDVDQVVQDFKDAGATEAKKTKQPNGKYTVVATFPDAPAKRELDAAPKEKTIPSGTTSTPVGKASGKAASGQILKGDGTWSWFAEIEGDDIIVRNAIATAFGGAADPMDSGETASGCPTKENPDLMGCALPMDGYGVASLKGSPLPKIPFGVHRDCSDNAGGAHVAVTHRASGKTITVPAIDLGPGKRTGHALDLTVAAAKKFDSSATANNFEMKLDYRIIDGAKFVR